MYVIWNEVGFTPCEFVYTKIEMRNPPLFVLRGWVSCLISIDGMDSEARMHIPIISTFLNKYTFLAGGLELEIDSGGFQRLRSAVFRLGMTPAFTK